MRTQPLYIVILYSAILLSGCHEKKGNGTKVEKYAICDSSITCSTDTIETNEALTALPDTSYASTSMLEYHIERNRHTNDSTITDFVDMYDNAPGIFTFRGNMTRSAGFIGTVTGTPDTIIVDWEFMTALAPPDTCQTDWGGGTGWTGQPVYVDWPDSIVGRMKASGIVNRNFSGQEIITGSLCHMLYFIDFATGKASREPIDVKNPIKGSVSLDPSLNGNLYIGHGVPVNKPFGHLVVNVYQGEITRVTPRDRNALRRWGAFDSSPLRVDRFLFWPGENGTLYKYVCANGKLIPHSALRYTSNGIAPGMETSISVYRNYGYTADNHGNIICTNLNTMRPVWCFANGDDTDASIVICNEDGIPYIYTCSEVDRKPDGPAFFRKLNALTGELIWETATPSKRADIDNKHFDGGYYASPLPGKGNCSELIFNNCVANTNEQNGDFIAIDRKSGKIVYKVALEHYAWSSPVGLINEKNEMFIFTGDTHGNVYLINGIDGKILCRRNIGINFESSPVVIGNVIVIGSRVKSIYKMSIR